MIALRQLATLLGAELQWAGADRGIAAVSSIGQAGPDAVVFADDDVSFAAALASQAGAVLVSPRVASTSATDQKPRLLCPQPRLAFARTAKLLAREHAAAGAAPSIHPTAIISETAQIAGQVSIGAYAVLEDSACVGSSSTIDSGAVIGKGVVIGSECHIYPRVVLYPGTTLGDRVVVHAGAVLGADGFGYVRDQTTGEYLQFPQQGSLVVEDDVEIGANTTIDRGALEETRIARGTKIDNLVHIGHNVSVGRNAVIAAQTGISGSSSVGHNAMLGGQVGIGDHALVGDGVILGGQAGVLPNKRLYGPGILFWGTPAQPVKRYLKQLASLARLSRSSRDISSSGARSAPSSTSSPREDE
ncbi:MAG TPA: UDP-3-O-(3-hydroxymyristoyl)glucosamine N-acyltransferase [Acidobacteriaceae bacterium]|jgi:UDP-3-O-[3-hydroxymyristoyl] glucosamine N-acyltransferase